MKASQDVALKLIDFYKDHAWTRGEYARDVDDEAIGPLSNKAVSWCILGAMSKLKISHTEHDNSVEQLAESLFGALKELNNLAHCGIAYINDTVYGTRDKTMEGLRKVAKGGE